MSPDRYPSRTGGPYSAPSNAMFGNTVDAVRDRTVREFGVIEEALRAFPPIGVNSVVNLWAPGALLSLATTTTAPAAGIRGVHPIALYVLAGTRDGSVSFRVVVPGSYLLRVLWSQDAPGGGTVRWVTAVNVLASDAGPTLEYGALGAGAAYNLSVAGPATNVARWSPLANLYFAAPCEVGVNLKRTPATAPDTATADAFVVGLALDRQGER